MTYETAIGMLETAQTGDQILQVLESLDRALTRSDYFTNEALTGGHHRSIAAVPTLEPMEF
jgi:predicted GTPase